MKSTNLDAELGVGGKFFFDFFLLLELFRAFDSCDIALIYVYGTYYGKITTKGSPRSI